MDAPKSFRIADRLNNKWEQFHDSGEITLRPQPLLTATDKVFTIGSCFANNVRDALQACGIKCLPDYDRISGYDQTRMYIGLQQSNMHMSHFNTYTILQEFERAAGLWTQAPNDYWLWTRQSPYAPQPTYQDPYHRLVGGITPDALHEVQARINGAMKEGFEAATAFFMTFGMTEVFRQKSNGRIVGQKPLYCGGAGLEETELYQSTYEDNYRNIARSIDIIRAQKPNAKIVISVSPIALARTFSDGDIALASMEGKSILRAAAGQIARDYPGVLYFPSYDLISYDRAHAFEPDGRHVEMDYVKRVINAFVDAYVAKEAS